MQKVRWADMMEEREGAERDQAEERRDSWDMKGEPKEAEARRQVEELCQEREWDRVESTATDEEGEGREWDPWRARG